MTWALAIDGPIVAAYRKSFGGGETFVGLTWLVGSLAIGIPGLLSALWVEPMKHKRGFVFWGHIAGGIALLLAAAAIRLWAPHSPLVASAVYVIGTGTFFLSVGILLPGWLALVGELFDGGMQSRVLGITFICNKVAAMLAGQFIARSILGNTWDPADQWSFMFLVAGAAAVIGSFPFLWIVESVRTRPAKLKPRAYFRSLRTALAELPALRRFVGADVIGIAMMVTLAYAGDAAIQGAGFESKEAGHWVFVGAGANVLMCALIAWRARRVHPRTWFVFGSIAGIGAALAAAWGVSDISTSMGAKHIAFDLAAAGIGFYMAVRASCHAPLVMRLSPGRDGTAPIGIAVALIMLMQGSAPMIGAWVIDGWGYVPLFLGVATCGALSVVLLLLRVPRDVPTRGSGNEDA